MLDQNLVSYIKESLNQGSIRPDIEKALLSNGWQKEMIDEGFNTIEQKPITPSSALPSSNWRAINKRPLIIICSIIFILALIFTGYKIYTRPKLEISNKSNPVNTQTPQQDDLLNNVKNNDVGQDVTDPVIATTDDPYPDKYCTLVSEAPNSVDLVQSEQVKMTDELQRIWLTCSQKYNYTKDERITNELEIEQTSKEDILKIFKILICKSEEIGKSELYKSLKNTMVIKAIDKQKYESCIANHDEEKNKSKIEECKIKIEPLVKDSISMQCSSEVMGSLRSLIDCSDKEKLISYGLTNSEADVIAKDKTNYYQIFFNIDLYGCLKGEF